MSFTAEPALHCKAVAVFDDHGQHRGFMSPAAARAHANQLVISAAAVEAAIAREARDAARRAEQAASAQQQDTSHREHSPNGLYIGLASADDITNRR